MSLPTLRATLNRLSKAPQKVRVRFANYCDRMIITYHRKGQSPYATKWRMFSGKRVNFIATGALIASRSNTLRGFMLEFAIGPTSRGYENFIHFGTSYQPPNPLVPDQGLPKRWESTLSRYWQKAIESRGKS